MKNLVISLMLVLIVQAVFACSEKGVESKKEPGFAPVEVKTMVITGKVIDQATGETLTGVKVSIEGSDTKVYTDFDGVFRFENVKPGEYDLTATLVSYNQNKVPKFNPVKDGAHLEIKMQSTL